MSGTLACAGAAARRESRDKNQNENQIEDCFQTEIEFEAEFANEIERERNLGDCTWSTAARLTLTEKTLCIACYAFA